MVSAAIVNLFDLFSIKKIFAGTILKPKPCYRFYVNPVRVQPSF